MRGAKVIKVVAAMTVFGAGLVSGFGVAMSAVPARADVAVTPVGTAVPIVPCGKHPSIRDCGGVKSAASPLPLPLIPSPVATAVPTPGGKLVPPPVVTSLAKTGSGCH